jgi:hypothetical protein
MGKIAELLTRAAAAKDTADQAAHELEAEQARADAERRRRHVAAWQQTADAYNPAQLRQDLTDAEAQLRRAAERSDLGRALVGYLTALLRQRTQADLAQDAAAAGATLPPGARHPERVASVYVADQRGGVPVLEQLITDLAQGAVIAEAEAARARAQAAYDSIETVPPTGWRISHVGAVDFTDTPGGHQVEFVNGVAYLPANHPAAAALCAHYERSEGFSVAPAYGLPPDYKAELRRRRDAKQAAS